MRGALLNNSTRRCGAGSRPAAAQPAAALHGGSGSRQRRRQHQQCRTHQHQQQQQRSSVVMRVRLDALENSNGPAPAAEALQTYMQLEQSGELNSVTAGNVRLKYGIRRGEDGRVQVRKTDGTWMQLKLDMEVRGTILLRNTVDDTVYVLQTERLEQIDLSDDYVLFMMFADNNWEQEIVPIQLADENGRASTLEMGEQQFKDYVGILKTLSEAEAAAREAVAQQGAGGGVAVGEDGAIDVTASEVRVPSNDTS